MLAATNFGTTSVQRVFLLHLSAQMSVLEIYYFSGMCKLEYFVTEIILYKCSIQYRISETETPKSYTTLLTNLNLNC